MRLKRCRHGALLFNIHDKYVGRSLDLYGEFSEGETALFRQVIRPGMVVCDIGANIGCHTVVMAAAVGPDGVVVAAEPQRPVFQTLCANVSMNGHMNVRAYHAAMGAAAGEIAVPLVRYDLEGNFGGLELGSHQGGERVPVMTLDSLPFGACHFIKIDVEGMEIDVLKGAARTIAKFQPVLYVENDRRDKSQALIEHLLAMDYRLYWHLPPLFNPGNFFANGDNVFGKIISRNMLGLPKDSAIEVRNVARITDPAAPF
ncbi:MAG: FkbM family methyltransferase [Rhodospirillales bacterium CG15_BIG_FIL_POST_REV_8_21_14_020_66_15]|nr:MAG: FkbM family methyltransferase [Rhodospirillales bacterium CG15_BIG_FIL_POST_REV_8_21_14_020_66_15]